jgi:hypothetical protein
MVGLYGNGAGHMHNVGSGLKFGTFFFLGFLMWYYRNYYMAAWIYLAMHGSYGLAWFIKDFPSSMRPLRPTICEVVRRCFLSYTC